LTLGRDKRLKEGSEFARTKNEGKRLVRGCLILNWLDREGANESRLGVITSKRIGNAVQRSRARRLMREAFRLHQNEFLKPVDVVLVARRSINEKRQPDVDRTFLKLAAEAGVIARPESEQ
jgi:ribonuclease P protein component